MKRTTFGIALGHLNEKLSYFLINMPLLVIISDDKKF